MVERVIRGPFSLLQGQRRDARVAGEGNNHNQDHIDTKIFELNHGCYPLRPSNHQKV